MEADKTQIGTACQGCHEAKVRCEKNGTSCRRCLRLNIDCLPRLSRQGQGPKKRRKTGTGSSTNYKSQNSVITTEDQSVLESVQERIVGRQNRQHHYGIRYLIHSWTSFAFARQSFALLSRASRLADQCGVSMGDIFCPRRRHVLDPLLYGTPSPPITTSTFESTPLEWSHVPPALLQACHLDATASSVENRYIMIREANQGQSRYLVSPAFERDLASLWLLQSTWQCNDQPVVMTFLEGPADFTKFTQAISYQMARYQCPSTVPEAICVPGLRVKVGGTVREMDLIYAFEIVTLEHSFYCSEYVVPASSHADLAQNETEFVPPLDLDDLDPDLQSILDLIKADM